MSDKKPLLNVNTNLTDYSRQIKSLKQTIEAKDKENKRLIEIGLKDAREGVKLSKENKALREGIEKALFFFNDTGSWKTFQRDIELLLSKDRTK